MYILIIYMFTALRVEYYYFRIGTVLQSLISDLLRKIHPTNVRTYNLMASTDRTTDGGINHFD